MTGVQTCALPICSSLSLSKRIRMSQSESLRASPLALDPYNIALLPDGIADLAISFIFNMVLSSVDISLIFYDGKDMVKKRKHKTFL